MEWLELGVKPKHSTLHSKLNFNNNHKILFPFFLESKHAHVCDICNFSLPRKPHGHIPNNNISTTDLFLPSVLLLTLFLIWLAGKKGHKYLLRIVNLTLTFKKLWGVSSVPFPFWFPFQLHCELVSSGISSQSVQNILIWRVT